VKESRRALFTRSAQSVGVAALGVFLAACGAQGGTAPGGGNAKSTKIGAALTLTTASSVYGQAQKNGIQLAVDEINGQNAVPGVKLDVVYEDDGGTPATGITVFQKLINQDKVTAIVGPTLSTVALSADPIAQQSKVPVLGVSNTANGVTDIGDYIWRDSLTEAVVIPNTVKKTVAKLSLKKVAIIYANDDAFSKSGYDEFKKALDASGVQIASTQTCSTNDKDFAAQLTQIKSANPDALIVSTLIGPAVPIVTQARQLLGDKIAIIGGNGLNSPAIIKDGAKAAEGVIVGAAWHQSSTNPKSQAFVKNYKAKYNADPDQFAAQAYAGAYIVAEAIKRAGADPTRDGVKKGFGEIKKLPTALGDFSFTAARDADHPPVVQVVKDGKFALYE
jgi:branched-chain amino acid transport system substrate-binding protein